MCDYARLLSHYQQMLKLFDVVHFNSCNTRDVYLQRADLATHKVLAITHSGVADNRVERNYSGATLRLIFIGSGATYKGLPQLLEVLVELKSEGYSAWQLDIWGAKGRSCDERIIYRGAFASDQLNSVFCRDALLVTPSVWSETFSFTTLEALSFGVPVLCSSSVGARDIVSAYDSWFVYSGREQLKAKLRELIQCHERLQMFNYQILNRAWNHSLKQHALEIEELYGEVL